MATGFKVTAAAVVLPTEDGSERYLYRSGAVLSAKGFTRKGLEHALEAGLIKKAELVDHEQAAADEAEAQRVADEKSAADQAEADRVAAEKAAADKKAADEAAAKEAAAAAKPGARGNAQTGK